MKPQSQLSLYPIAKTPNFMKEKRERGREREREREREGEKGWVCGIFFFWVEEEESDSEKVGENKIKKHLQCKQ
jgi:hypothetical protein